MKDFRAVIVVAFMLCLSIFAYVTQGEEAPLVNNMDHNNFEIQVNKIKLDAQMLEAKSIYDISNFGVTIYDLPYWADGFADELSNASRNDKSYLQKKLSFCQQYVEMHEDFSDKELPNLGNVRSTLAETYYQLEEKEKADLLYEKWLKDEPDWGWGWIAWSDCYWLRRHIGLEQDLEKAEQILRKGLSVKKVSDKEHIEERLNRLLNENNQLND